MLKVGPKIFWPWLLVQSGPYFADLTQRGDRGWKEAQRQGEDSVTLRQNLNMFLLLTWFAFDGKLETDLQQMSLSEEQAPTTSNNQKISPPNLSDISY